MSPDATSRGLLFSVGVPEHLEPCSKRQIIECRCNGAASNNSLHFQDAVDRFVRVITLSAYSDCAVIVLSRSCLWSDVSFWHPSENPEFFLFIFPYLSRSFSRRNDQQLVDDESMTEGRSCSGRGCVVR